MVDRAAVAFAILAPIPVLAAFQGMLTAGLFPLALFGPAYAAARLLQASPEDARVAGTRLTAAASVGVGFALLPALAFLAHGLDPVPERLTGIGLGVTAAGVGTLAGLATTPEPRDLTPTEKRRWTLVEALDRSHARGLVLLFAVALPAATGLGLLREAPLFAAGPGPGTLPQALLGDHAIAGQLVLPDPGAWAVVVVPLSLAPIAVGFLASPRQATPVAAGGLVMLGLAPLAVWLGVPVETAEGSLIPLDLRPRPGFEAIRALAPAGGGVLLGAGLMHVGTKLKQPRFVSRVAWAAAGAAPVLLVDGAAPALALLAGVCVAALAVSWRTGRAPLGAALAVGALAGLVVGAVATAPEGLAIGAIVGIVAGGAVVTSTTTRTLLLPEESVRSPRTLGYLLIMVALGGAVAWTIASTLGSSPGTVLAPHARGLAGAVEAVVTSRGDLLLVWGLLVGLLVQWAWGRGGLFAVGLLVGPGVALLLLVGSLLRAVWESTLLERAREGFVMRGELGYELLRAHVLVVAVLAGEAIALAFGPLLL